MPELQFKGKEFVYNHHLTVPFRPLEMDASKGIGAPRLDGNLIIHGDNLHALKALLPTHASKVDCIFIDPPYNTGNEGWAYNDNVNSPMIKEWLTQNPIGVEDGLRHDKWACMMWPRLRLLQQLLSDSGSIWVTCDDNEVHRLRQILDEIFGDSAFVGIFVVENNRKGRNDKENIALTHEYMIVYSNDEYLSRGLEISASQVAEFDQTAGDGRKFATRDLRKRGSEDRREDRESMFFPVYWNKVSNTVSMARQSEADAEILPLRGDGSEGRWRWGKARVASNLDILVPREGQSGRLDVDYMVFLDSANEEGAATRKKPKSVWIGPKYSTDHATTLIKNIFGNNPLSHAPKALEHVVDAMQLAVGSDGLVLDSFAGSGTTAHAVLAANARDGGDRRFILIEGEDYADTLTAERVRRVSRGYAFKGTQREELLREPITFSKLKGANALLEQVQRIETLDGPKFDRIKPTVKDGVLIVTGERDVAETAPGLGGDFTYCTLGAPVEMDAILSGEGLPAPAAMAGLLWHTATAQPFDPSAIKPAPEIGEGVARLGAFAGRTYWLFYRDDLAWLKSGEAALSLTKARAIAATGAGNHLVFAPAKFVSRELLASERLDVDYAPLPFALYRLETA